MDIEVLKQSAVELTALTIAKEYGWQGNSFISETPKKVIDGEIRWSVVEINTEVGYVNVQGYFCKQPIITKENTQIGFGASSPLRDVNKVERAIKNAVSSVNFCYKI